jgi:hypothetical protein
MPTRKSPSDAAKTKTAPKRRGTRKAKSAPDQAAIAERAYFIHLAEDGHDEVSNWLRAERELAAA